MIVRVPSVVVPFLSGCRYRRVREFAGFVVSLLVSSRSSVPVHSRWISDCIHGSRYRSFLDLMESLGVVGRTDSYLAATCETKRCAPFCKEWYRLDGPEWDDLVEFEIDFDFIKKHGKKYDIPWISELIESMEALAESLDVDLGNVTADRGGRVYSNFTRMTREERRKLDVVEIDATCANYWFVAVAFSPPSERERLISAIEHDIYQAVEGDRKTVKEWFLRGLYQRNCHNPAWKWFKSQFPKTAWRIQKVRDSGHCVYSSPEKRTYWGQRYMSRLLTRHESRVFNRAIGMAWKHAKIPAARIHDAIIVKHEHAERMEEFIQESFRHFFGRCAPLKQTRYPKGEEL